MGLGYREQVPLGRLFATPEVLKLITRQEITFGIKRHAVGDWGEGDKEKNDESLEHGKELVSRYRLSGSRMFFVKTSDDRSQTIVLLESELEL